MRSAGPGLLAALGVLVAWAVPQSIVFPMGAPARVAVVVAAVVLGTTLSRRIGLAVEGHGVLRGACIGLAFGAYAALVDGLVFRAHIPSLQLASIASLAAWQRIAVFVPLSLVDEIVYRLFLVSLLAWVFGASDGAFRLAIVAGATIYVLLHLHLVTGGGPLTAPLAARELALHVTAGSLWGWLFWRSGLATAIVAHACAHVTLQIGLGLLLGG